MPPFPSTPAWQALLAHRDALASRSLAALWEADADRGAALTFPCAGLAVDFSKQRVTAETLALLAQLARECGLPEAVERLFTGGEVNPSEHRPALHTALRGDELLTVGGVDVRAEMGRYHERMRIFAEAVREGHWKSATGARFTHVLAIGIGGSSQGPRLVIEALAGEADGPEVRFVSNIDAAELDDAIRGLDPATTLVVMASKTFSTQETLANGIAAREWIVSALGESAVARHMIAGTANTKAAADFGLPECNVFAFGESIGGRYSLWSSVGLPIAIALGMARFEQLLAGAHAADLHFRSDPLERNVPALLGLVSVWNRNALGIASHAVLPYASRLESFPAYVQQLEMESNGKSVSALGEVLGFATSPVVWGGVGTPGQHAFHQWLHQGSDVAACDFVIVAHPMGANAAHHEILLAHACAQSEALMNGVDSPEPHRACPGNRPSTTIVLPRLDPFHLGALLAACEHKIFTEAAIWGVNPFDQFGVELGKKIAERVLPAVRGAEVPLHPATRHLLAVVRRLGSA
ncbi:MAG TPA: glucose-6-phosphate isomerase [Usitatibacter sp.]|nr:glucose-6-phosphate isomerase [Usitatibacter sp.]